MFVEREFKEEFLEISFYYLHPRLPLFAMRDEILVVNTGRLIIILS